MDTPQRDENSQCTLCGRSKHVLEEESSDSNPRVLNLRLSVHAHHRKCKALDSLKNHVLTLVAAAKYEMFASIYSTEQIPSPSGPAILRVRTGSRTLLRT